FFNINDTSISIALPLKIDLPINPSNPANKSLFGYVYSLSEFVTNLRLIILLTSGETFCVISKYGASTHVSSQALFNLATIDLSFVFVKAVFPARNIY